MTTIGHSVILRDEWKTFLDFKISEWRAGSSNKITLPNVLNHILIAKLDDYVWLYLTKSNLPDAFSIINQIMYFSECNHFMFDDMAKETGFGIFGIACHSHDHLVLLCLDTKMLVL